MGSRMTLWLAVLGLVLSGQAASAGPPQVVVELFTSQGCSSCPPADAVLGELARRPNVIALTFPVDYWDYLGWKDTLAQPGFAARQRAYAHLRGDRQVYTPQLIVNGHKPCVGSDRAQIEQFLTPGSRDATPLSAEVALAEEGGTVIVSVAGASDVPAVVWVLPIAKAKTVAIARGENRGRTVTYANVVRGMIRVADWTGGEARFEIPRSVAQGEADGYVVLLQAAHGVKPGAILGAAKSAGL
jgi:hypothetical protein